MTNWKWGEIVRMEPVYNQIYRYLTRIGDINFSQYVSSTDLVLFETSDVFPGYYSPNLRLLFKYQLSRDTYPIVVVNHDNMPQTQTTEKPENWSKWSVEGDSIWWLVNERIEVNPASFFFGAQVQRMDRYFIAKLGGLIQCVWIQPRIWFRKVRHRQVSNSFNEGIVEILCEVFFLENCENLWT